MEEMLQSVWQKFYFDNIKLTGAYKAHRIDSATRAPNLAFINKRTAIRKGFEDFLWANGMWLEQQNGKINLVGLSDEQAIMFLMKYS